MKRDWRLVYIMGTARSGTTVLEILLGAAPSALNVGEIAHVYRDGFLEDATCACGRPFSACEMWGRVRERLGWTPTEIGERERLSHALDWHVGFPRTAAGLRGEETWRRYCRTQASVYDAISEVTGERVLVESSIYPGRALALSRCFPGRVRVVCLTRSPEGLLHSFRKPNETEQRRKSLPGILAYYVWVLVCVRVALRRLGDGATAARYEELRRDPESVVSRLESRLELDLSGVRDRLARDESFQVGHIVTGNRLRRQGRVRFQRGGEDPPARGPGERLTLLLMRLARRLLAP